MGLLKPLSQMPEVSLCVTNPAGIEALGKDGSLRKETISMPLDADWKSKINLMAVAYFVTVENGQLLLVTVSKPRNQKSRNQKSDPSLMNLEFEPVYQSSQSVFSLVCEKSYRTTEPNHRTEIQLPIYVNYARYN